MPNFRTQEFPLWLLTKYRSFPKEEAGGESLFVAGGTPLIKAHDAPVHDIVRRHYNTVYRTQTSGLEGGAPVIEWKPIMFLSNFREGGSCTFLWYAIIRND